MLQQNYASITKFCYDDFEIQELKKETQSFVVFGMQKKIKYFLEERENRRKISSFHTPINARILHLVKIRAIMKRCEH